MRGGVGEIAFRWFDKALAVLLFLLLCLAIWHSVRKRQEVIGDEPRRIKELSDLIENKRRRSRPKPTVEEKRDYAQDLAAWRRSVQDVQIATIPGWIFNWPKPVLYQVTKIAPRPDPPRPAFTKELKARRPLDRGTVKCDDGTLLRTKWSPDNPRVVEIEPLKFKGQVPQPTACEVKGRSGEVWHIFPVVVDPNEPIDILEPPVVAGVIPDLQQVAIGFNPNPKNIELISAGKVAIEHYRILRYEPGKGAEGFVEIDQFRYEPKGGSLVKPKGDPPEQLTGVSYVYLDRNVSPATTYIYKIEAKGRALSVVPTPPMTTTTLNDVDFKCTATNVLEQIYMFRVRKWVPPDNRRKEGNWEETTFASVTPGQEIGGMRKVKVGQDKTTTEVDFRTGCIMLGCVQNARRIEVRTTDTGEQYNQVGLQNVILFQDRNGKPGVRWKDEWGTTIPKAGRKKKKPEKTEPGKSKEEEELRPVEELPE